MSTVPHSMRFAVTDATEAEVRSGVVGRSLREFNHGVVGE